MVAVNEVGLGLAVLLTLLAVAVHFSRGTEWTPGEDIAGEVLDRRAETVPETEFPEPMNRSVGGGAAAAGAIAGGAEGEGAELEGGEKEDAGPAAIPDDEVEYHEVEFVKEGETVELANNKTILDQGEGEGWDLPYACRQGQCVSCSGRILEGPAEEYVTHHTQEMLDETELEEGYTLTCVAYPKADFTIETGEAP